MLRRRAEIERVPLGLLMRSSEVMESASSRLAVWIWLGRSGMVEVKTSRMVGIRPGWAAHVPSWPARTSRSLSFRTSSSAAAFAAGSSLIGI